MAGRGFRSAVVGTGGGASTGQGGNAAGVCGAGETLREKTTGLVDKWRREGAKVAAYGAARSGPTLIAQLGLAGSIEYIVDDHPQKVGKYSSGDGIPIIPISELYERQPDYAVILAWVHAQKIIESNRKYLEKGGHFVVLCPETRIIGKEGSLAV